MKKNIIYVKKREKVCTDVCTLLCTDNQQIAALIYIIGKHEMHIYAHFPADIHTNAKRGGHKKSVCRINHSSGTHSSTFRS